MAPALQEATSMNTTWTAHAVTTHTRGLAAAGFMALALLLGPVASAAAPSDDGVMPADMHTSEKGKRLAQTYQAPLREISAKIYHCVPWVEVKKNAIGFYKPKHMTGGDTRYLSINLYIDQQPSAEFAAYKVEDRASRMFSRYVGPMLRRLASPPGLMADPNLDGFTVILEWLKQTPAAKGDRPVHETIAVFLDKPTVAGYLNGRLSPRDLASRARILAWDGETALGALRLASWDDDFVATYKVSNYQLAPGVSCP
jgi:hypothetical protein